MQNVYYRGYDNETQFGEYPNGNVRLQLVNEYDQVSVVSTVELDWVVKAPQMAIVTWTENDDNVDSLIMYDVIKPNIISQIPYGNTVADIVELTDEAYQEFLETVGGVK